MPEKPRTAAGYAPEQVERVRATCLYLASKLGDLMDEMVVVGGLVPSLLIDQTQLPEETSPHVGTMDLDVGLAFVVVAEHHYQAITERLRRAGFQPEVALAPRASNASVTESFTPSSSWSRTTRMAARSSGALMASSA